MPRKDYPPEPMSTLLDFWRDSPSGRAIWVFLFIALDDNAPLGWSHGPAPIARKTAAWLSDRDRPCKMFKMTTAV